MKRLAFAPLAIALLAPAIARADVAAAEFIGAEIDFTLALPATNASVPVNGRLIAFSSFNADNAVVFSRFEGSDTTALDAEMLASSGPNQAAYLVDLGPLAAGDVLQVTCSSCFDQLWRATVTAADDEPPVFGEGNKNRIGVTDLGKDVGYQVRACIPAPVDAAANGVALRIITDAGESYTTAFQVGCGLGEVEATAFAAGDERRFCFQTLAVDAAGNEALFHEDICTNLPPHDPALSGGCAQTSTASPMLAAALIAFARWRRRAARALIRAA